MFSVEKNHIHVKKNIAFIKRNVYLWKEAYIINVSIIFSGNNCIFDHIEVHTIKSVALCVSGQAKARAAISSPLKSRLL